jgi:hypothetical protein
MRIARVCPSGEFHDQDRATMEQVLWLIHLRGSVCLVVEPTHPALGLHHAIDVISVNRPSIFWSHASGETLPAARQC